QVGSWSLAASRRWTTTEGGRFAGFSPDGKTLATTDRNAIHLVASPSLTELATLECPSPLALGLLCFSPDGCRLARTTGDRLIELWDLRLIREQLVAMKLDWDAPPLPAPATNQFAGKIIVTVLGTTNASNAAERTSP